MDIIVRELNKGGCKSYLVLRAGGNKAVLIDPLLKYLSQYLLLMDEEGLILEACIDTHTHADHLSAAPALKDATGARYLMNENSTLECVDHKLPANAELELGDRIPFKFIYTPGHNEDSMVVVVPGAIFTGDTLFLGKAGAGRDDLPGGDPAKHWESLQRLLELDERFIIYPGHEYRGLQPTSLAKQKTENPYLLKKSKHDFVLYIEDLKLGAADWMHDVVRANTSCTRDFSAATVHDETPACESKGTLSHDACDIEVPYISVSQLSSMLESDNPPVLIDVRDPHELFEELGHIEGCINLPIDHLFERFDEIIALSNKLIVLICRSDPRAYTTGQILMDEGIKNVTVLQGGMVEWLNHQNSLAVADSLQ